MEDRDFKILIVDDSESVREMLKDFFKRYSEYQIFDAPDGLRGLDFLGNNEVHLVITDIVMPEIDGLTLLKKMKFKKPEVPIIVISGFSSQDNIDMAHKYYAENFFSKPFEWNDLTVAIKKAKQVYEENIMSKELPQDMSINLELEIRSLNSKNTRFFIEKIVKLLTGMFLISYDEGTEYYIIFNELFMICKKVFRTVKDENYIIFRFEQYKSSLKFKVFDAQGSVKFSEFIKEKDDVWSNFIKYGGKPEILDAGKTLSVSKDI